ncbi:1-deoxy-D-xylulose-5-phosphate reductoisomerase [Sutcliffiella halmapala]|uniref:1-deoxy-D-xylulose-5-phosphate reductoisomerase n=1 Tax=Sutcliffiella halmapala TaxID=79882 RepID=UPI000995705D|nr:1-deoxy-D-xylulose-5-phosphate reductoisomerase [Sutcliffiella halmapala]
MKKITILGSTGSIGTSTLDVVRQHPDKFKVVGLTALNNIDLMIQQINEFRPMKVSIGNKDLAEQLRLQIPSETEIYYGVEGVIEVAANTTAEIVMSSVVGAAGILPTIEALKSGKDIAIANKETLVAAGQLVTEIARENNCKLIPVDSEHSAIYQCLNGENEKDIERLIVTASGGAFRDRARDEMRHLKAYDALKHPNWNMGAKLTIDCATLMNKGFEVIEAHWLFDIPYEKIDVLVHKESIIHSMVEFIDGSVMAQLGAPDMRVPIQYALEHPRRLKGSYQRLNFAELTTLHFEMPDLERFPCLQYAFNAGKAGGTMPAVLNAANEVANRLFLEGKIGFLDIEKLLYETMSSHQLQMDPSLDDIFEADQWARKAVKNYVKILH